MSLWIGGGHGEVQRLTEGDNAILYRRNLWRQVRTANYVRSARRGIGHGVDRARAVGEAALADIANLVGETDAVNGRKVRRE